MQEYESPLVGGDRPVVRAQPPLRAARSPRCLVGLTPSVFLLLADIYPRTPVPRGGPDGETVFDGEGVPEDKGVMKFPREEKSFDLFQIES